MNSYKYYREESMRLGYGDASDLSDFFEGELNTHHRVPKSITFDHKGGFPVKLKKKYHDDWHMLFSTCRPTCICIAINKYFLGKNWKFICKHRKSNFMEKVYSVEKVETYCVGPCIHISNELYAVWDDLFADKNPFEICRIINKFFIDPEWRFVCKHKKKFYGRQMHKSSRKNGRNRKNVRR